MRGTKLDFGQQPAKQAVDAGPGTLLRQAAVQIRGPEILPSGDLAFQEIPAMRTGLGLDENDRVGVLQ